MLASCRDKANSRTAMTLAEGSWCKCHSSNESQESVWSKYAFFLNAYLLQTGTGSQNLGQLFQTIAPFAITLSRLVSILWFWRIESQFSFQNAKYLQISKNQQGERWLIVLASPVPTGQTRAFQRAFRRVVTRVMIDLSQLLFLLVEKQAHQSWVVSRCRVFCQVARMGYMS